MLRALIQSIVHDMLTGAVRLQGFRTPKTHTELLRHTQQANALRALIPMHAKRTAVQSVHKELGYLEHHPYCGTSTACCKVPDIQSASPWWSPLAAIAKQNNHQLPLTQLPCARCCALVHAGGLPPGPSSSIVIVITVPECKARCGCCCCYATSPQPHSAHTCCPGEQQGHLKLLTSLGDEPHHHSWCWR